LKPFRGKKMLARVTRRTTMMAVAAAAMLSGTSAQAAPPADLQARADALVERTWPADGPGAAVIITQGGRTIYARGRGLANVEARTPISPDTVFRLGSITKQFTSSVIMQLVQEGRIGLDDPLSRFLPDYPQSGASATVRQLLNHTSGVQSYTGIPGFMGSDANTNRPYTTAQMVDLFRDLPSPTRPGEAWNYNNSGYVLLGAIIEQVTGKAWHEAVAERITRPLGLTTIRYGVGEERIPNMARGYTRDDDVVRLARPIHMSVPHAAGALTGTVRDLAGWAQALHHGRVVSAQSYAQMVQPAALPEGRTHPYGFGLGLGDLRGRATVGHGGGIFGFGTASTYVPSEDLFVAVFTNSDTHDIAPDVTMNRLAALALGDPYPEFTAVALDMAAVEPLTGLYRIDGATAERRFFARDGKLYTQRADGPPQEVFSAGGGRFFYGPASLTWFQIRPAADGAHVMEMHQEGAQQAERALRTGPVPAEAAAVTLPRNVLERYVGAYRMPIGQLTVAVDSEGALTAQLPGQPPVHLDATSETEFRVREVGAALVFTVENGRVTRATIRQGGRELSGERVADGS
jgi:D-alanyl-D-alanine carboxypeptidase